jgi:NitT/TauT family transport system substrate-binding protein
MRAFVKLLALFFVFAVAAPAIAQTTPVLVGIGTREADSLGYFAQDMGFFKKIGLNVELQQFSAGPQIAAAIASGHLQIGDSNIINLAGAHARGLPFVYIAGMNVFDASKSTALAAVSPASTIKSGKDLNGQTIAGVSLNSIDQAEMMAWIDKTGGDWQSVKFIEVPPGEMPAALQANRIAAAIVNDPELSAFLAAKSIKVVGNPVAAIGPRYLGNGWIATKEWADANPDLVKKFQQAIALAADWANTHPEEAATILNKYTKTQIATLHARFTKDLDPKMIQPILDAAAKYKVIPRQMSASEIIWKGR